MESLNIACNWIKNKMAMFYLSSGFRRHSNNEVSKHFGVAYNIFKDECPLMELKFILLTKIKVRS